MKKQILIPAVSIFIFVLTTGVWAAESCAAEKLNLKLRLKAGQKYSMRITTEQKISQTIQGKKQDFNQMLAVGIGFEVEEVDANGVASLKVTYRMFKLKTPDGMEYDSTKFDKIPGKKPEQFYTAMIGQSFMMKIAPNGKILELKGIDKMLLQAAEKIIEAEDELITKAPVGTCKKNNAPEAQEKISKQERAKRRIEALNNRYGSREKRAETLKVQMKGVFTEEKIKYVFSPWRITFPDRLVGIGDSWVSKMTLAWAVLPVEVDSTYTLKGNEKGIVTIDMSSKRDLDDEVVSFGKRLMKLPGSYHETLEVDETSGWLIRSKAHMKISGEMIEQGMRMPISMESVITVEPME